MANEFGITWPNHVSAAASVITPGSEASGFDADNMLNARVYSRWHSTDLTAGNATFDMDLLSSKIIDAVWIAACNCIDGDNWRIRTSDDPTFVTGVYDSTSIEMWDTQIATDFPVEPAWGRVARHILTTSQTHRYVRIDFTSTNPDGFVAVARAEASELVQPNLSFRLGDSKTRVPVGPQDHPRYARTREYKFRAFDETSLYTFDGIAQEAGVDNGLLVIPDVGRTDLVLRDELYCELQSMPTAVSVIATRWNLSLRVKEVSE